jgi:hypothetical protein
MLDEGVLEYSQSREGGEDSGVWMSTGSDVPLDRISGMSKIGESIVLELLLERKFQLSTNCGGVPGIYFRMRRS